MSRRDLELETTARARSRRRSAPAPATPRRSPRTRPGARSGSTRARSRASPRPASAGSASAPGSTAGSATPTAPTSPSAGIAAIAAGAVEAARVADPDEFAAAPEPAGEPTPIDGLADPTRRRVEDRAQGRARAGRSSAPPATPTPASSRSRPPSTPTSARTPRSPPRAGSPASYEATSLLRLPLRRSPRPTATARPGSASASARSPAALDPEAIGREAAERATSLLGATKPASRTCPVVLDETVAASFVGFIGGVLGADAVQRGRSPFAGRLGEQIGSAALTLADDGADPAGAQLGAVRRRGHADRPHRADRGAAAWPPTSTTPTPRAASGGRRHLRSTANAGALRLSLARRRSRPRTWSSQPASSASRQLLAEAGEGIYVTDVAGLHSGVNPVSGTFSVGATGRAISGGELAEPPTSSRSPATWSRCWPRSAPPAPSRAGSRSAARSRPRRC